MRRAVATRWPRRNALHPGDVVWRMSSAPRHGLGRDLHLWLEGERVAGFAWFESRDELTLDALAELSEGRLADQMLAWAERRARELWADDGAEAAITSSVLNSDPGRVALFEDRGYVRSERGGVHMRFASTGPEAPRPPAGMRVRHITPADHAERVDVHRAAWSDLEQIGIPGARSRYSLAQHRWLCDGPLYDPELDLVVETADGRFASCCICWLDRENALGIFEPVGTRPEFRRQGVGRALILEGVRRLQAKGARTVIIGTASFNAPAIGLYTSCGFEAVDRDHWYTRSLSA